MLLSQCLFYCNYQVKLLMHLLHGFTIFLQNIDVDQIVMNHFQSSSTPQPTISKLPPFTPAVLEENNLPSELCLNCSHNIKVYYRLTYLPDYRYTTKYLWWTPETGAARGLFGSFKPLARNEGLSD